MPGPWVLPGPLGRAPGPVGPAAGARPDQAAPPGWPPAPAPLVITMALAARAYAGRHGPAVASGRPLPARLSNLDGTVAPRRRRGRAACQFRVSAGKL